jgi:hypothetical protein
LAELAALAEFNPPSFTFPANNWAKARSLWATEPPAKAGGNLKAANSANSANSVNSVNSVNSANSVNPVNFSS